MTSELRWKAAVILGLVLVCLFGLVCFRKGPEGETQFKFPLSWADLRENVENRINLGLDLRGGMHLILQVQVEQAIKSETDQLTQRLPAFLREQAIPFQAVTKLDPLRVQVTGIPAERLSDARTLLLDTYRNSYTIGTLPAEKSGFVLELTPSAAAQIRQDTQRAAIEIIRSRVDSLGVSEPTITEHGRGEWEILVQLPGVDDPARVKNFLQSTAMLEIKLVQDGPYASESEALTKFGGILPPDAQLLPHRDICAKKEETNPNWYLVTRSAAVGGRDLRNARAEVNPEAPGTYEVAFTLSRDGAARFGPFTERNINKPLAVVLDNKVQSVATIRARIEDSGRITGSFDLKCADDLAKLLRSGALPADIKYLEERTVGPSLGADSIREGLLASVTGLLAVGVFMLAYYRLSGVNAIATLLLNLLILLAALAYFGATLTLPGIAGVALTIGMAVDANVLVFERIREELRTGKGVVTAVGTGFDRAFNTIFDANATTIIAAVFLFTFGTGPIKGFAVTLTLGLLANLFAAVFVSRTIFEYVLGRQAAGGRAQPATLSI